MSSENFSSWIEEQLLTLGVDPKKMPPNASAASPSDGKELYFPEDLSFITLFDLMNLFLTLDYCQDVFGKVKIFFPGSFMSKFPVMPFEKYSRYKKKPIDSYPIDVRNDFLRADKIYKFISFCNYFGLFDALRMPMESERINCIGVDSSNFNNLYEYSGVRSGKSRVLPLTAIINESDVNKFRVSSLIQEWVSSLPDDIKKSPVFLDGEFSRVIGYQLGNNIIEHSGKGWRGESGAFGAIAMRVIKEDEPWVKDSFPERMKSVFDPQTSRGILEVCVGDRGLGINATLKQALTDLRKRFVKTGSISIKDVIAFAFDEIGSSKPVEKRFGGAHALHRILKCAIKYNGVIRVRTGGYEFIYNVAESSLKKNPDNALGIYTDDNNIKEVIHPFGTQLQILLPLTPPDKQSYDVLHRGITSATPKKDFKIVSVASYFPQDVLMPNENSQDRLNRLASELGEGLYSTIIVYDFGGQDLGEELFAYFLHSQKRVLHSHSCIGIGLNAGMAKTLREKEKLDPTDEVKKEFGVVDFFEVLSTQHRLFSVLDTSSKLWWFGLGRYDFDDTLTALFKSTEPLSLKNLADTGGIYEQTEKEKLLLYLICNDKHMFSGTDAGSERRKWTSLITKDDFEYALSNVVRLKLPEILTKLECIKKGDYYKLPSESGFADTFIHTTPLFQDEVSAQQIGEWMALAVRGLIAEGSNNDKLAFICATAPGELLARTIANALPEKFVHIFNVGYYSVMDEGKLLRPEDWQMPIIIVTDIVNYHKTTGKILELLDVRGVNKPQGLVSLIEFVDPGEENRTMVWKDSFELKDVTVPLKSFYLEQMKRPATVEHSVAHSKKTEDNLWLLDPFSLENFRYSVLSRERYKDLERRNQERLLLLEQIGALRYGHWVHGSHHFKVTTSIRSLLESDDVAGEICEVVMKLCKEKEIDHILVPLHSQIADLIPRIISGLNLVLGRQIAYTFCVSVMAVGKRSFYVVPNRIEKLIFEYAGKVSEGKRGIRLLVLDDAISSGQTLETLLRNLILRARKAYNISSLSKSPIDAVFVYTVLDRQGRSRSTVWTGLRKIALSGDGEWEAEDGSDPSFDFRFENWISRVMPVENTDTCGLCKERKTLAAIGRSLDSLDYPEDHFLREFIDERMKEIEPCSTDTETIRDMKQRALPYQIIICKRVQAGTVELALWEWYNALHRGYPIGSLLSDYELIIKTSKEKDWNSPNFENLVFLIREMGRLFFREWKLVTSHWSARPWKKLLLTELAEGTLQGAILVKELLPEAGMALAGAPSARSILKEIFNGVVDHIAKLDDIADPDYTLRENLYRGCVLFCLYYSCNSRSAGSIGGKRDPQLEEILGYVEGVCSSGDVNSKYSLVLLQTIHRTSTMMGSANKFIPALITIMHHTVRAGRHTHQHLLPYGIDQLRQGFKLNASLVRSISERLSLFFLCFDIVKEYYHIIPEKNDYYLDLKQLCDIFIKHLNEWDLHPGEQTPDVIKRLAGDIYVIFPIWERSSIYKKLVELNWNLNVIVQETIKEECENRRYKFILQGMSDIQCLIPNIEVVKGWITNYLFDVPIDSDFCEKPSIIAVVKDESTSEKVELNIYTNFQRIEFVRGGFSSGHARGELNGYPYELFGIVGNIVAVEDAAYPGYTAKITFKAHRGVRTKQEKL